MCGFIGFVGLGFKNTDFAFSEALQKIEHRGPDDYGIEQGEWWKLGFRRLSILDLSSAGHQPMNSSTRNSIIVFNGELYNYREISKILISNGISLKGDSDTEVFLNYYEFLNGNIPLLLEKCNGMFSFAIIDKLKCKLYLGRDRLGVKPIYFSYTNQGVVFGSEIKSIKPLLKFKTTVSTSAIGGFLNLGFVPSWESTFNEIDMLKPGYWAEWTLKSKKIKLHQYWKPSVNTYKNLDSEKEYIEEISDILYDATRIRLKSDVPVGIFLSGGIDSGLIASQIKKCGREDIMAHTIRFPGWENDESELAKKTAEHLNIELKIHDSDIPSMDSLKNIIGHFDQPFSDPSSIVTSLICEKAKEYSTVILTGDGGDEAFSGYREYSRALKYEWIDSVPDEFNKLIGGFFSRCGDGDLHRIGQRLKLSKHVRSAWTHIYPLDETITNLLQTKDEFYFNPKELQNILPYNSKIDALSRAQIGDLSVYLPDNVLRKSDRMSMMHSLELRSPFLDYRLVNLGLSIPPHLRLKNGVTKYMLRELAKEFIPSDVLTAPKRGFGVPLDHYLLDGDNLKNHVIEVLYELRKTGWFSEKQLSIFIGKKSWKNTNLRHVYRLFCLGIWLNFQ